MCLHLPLDLDTIVMDISYQIICIHNPGSKRLLTLESGKSNVFLPRPRASMFHFDKRDFGARMQTRLGLSHPARPTMLSLPELPSDILTIIILHLDVIALRALSHVHVLRQCALVER